MFDLPRLTPKEGEAMRITIDIIGHIDRYLGIEEPNHKVEIEMQDASWDSINWEMRDFFLSELCDVLRHSLTKFGQAHYTIHANQKKGLEYDNQD